MGVPLLVGTALIRGLYLGPEGVTHSIPVNQVPVDWGGFVGDRHYGLTRRSGVREKRDYPKGTEIRNFRQVSIVSVTELEQMAGNLGVSIIQPEWLSANVLLDGLPHLTGIQPLTRVFFQSGAVIVIYAENTPCIAAGQEVSRHLPSVPPSKFPKATMGLRGVVGWIECPGQGRLAVGEAAVVKPPTGRS